MDAATRSFVGSALVPAWLPALDVVENKLTAGATVADVGRGYGAPLIAMAHAFPQPRFLGFDYHDRSIARARQPPLRRVWAIGAFRGGHGQGHPRPPL